MKWFFLAPWREWGACNPFSKGVVAASLVLLLVAYLPTLQYDYVAQDQWRAFRYSVEGEPPLQRGKWCGLEVWQFYLQTGRPFVWFGECVEHTAVSRISDFRYLRPVVFGVVLLTVLYLGFLLAPFIGGLPMGIAAAAAFAVAPGYSFMYLQGMPAVMVLISILLSALSFLLYRKGGGHHGRPGLKVILTSGMLFIAACLIYPAYAFIVVAMILIELGFGPVPLLMARARLAVNKLLFYVCASLVYYALVQANLFLLRTFKGELPIPAIYDVAIQKSPVVLFERLSVVAQYFWHMPLFNFETPPGLALFILVTFSVAAVRSSVSKSGKRGVVALVSGAFICAVSVILLFGSVSPWLMSNMDSLTTRHVVPWYLFFCASTVGLISFLFSYFPAADKWAPFAVVLLFALPLAAAQYRLSLLEVIVTNAEVESIRSRLSIWAQNKGWIDKKYLLVVLPSQARPSFVEQMVSKDPLYGTENAVLATSQNPVAVPWMLNAVFREINGRPPINLIDCSFDQSCANAAVQNEGTVVLGYTRGPTEIRSPVEPFVINLSLLTSQPIMPIISRMDNAPTVKASSTHGNLWPYGLLTALPPGWHSEWRPHYPQTLDIDLAEAKTFRKLLLLPQDRYVSRMPGSLDMSIRSETGDWMQVGHFDGLCDAAKKDGWHSIALEKEVRARFIKLVIVRNCGDPDLLTLKGLRFE